MTLEHRHPRTRLGIKARNPTAMPCIHPSQLPPACYCTPTRQPQRAGACSGLELSRQVSSPGHALPGVSGLEAEPTSRTGTLLHPAVQTRLWSSFTAQHLQSPPSAGTGCRSEPGAEPRWQPSTAQRFPANPPGDTGRSREAHPGSHAQHCQAPACSPESAVTGRQRRPGHQRSQREGSRGASAAKGCRGRLTPAC